MHFLLKLVAYFYSILHGINAQNIFSFYSAYNVTTDIAQTAYEYILSNTGVVDTCPFTINMVTNANEILSNNIQCQDQAVSSIINSVASWEFQRRSGLSQALLLVFSGPTGQIRLAQQ